MEMHQAYAIETALQAKGDFFGWIQRAIHPAFYPEPNPNPYPQDKDINPHQGLVGFRFEIRGTTDIREAYRVVCDEIITPTIGTDHDLEVDEVMVSRSFLRREQLYHPLHNPTGI